MTARAGALAALAALAVAACAKVAPPPGGPEDRDPPVLAEEALRPAPGAAAVPGTDPVVFVFSEGMDRRSVMRSLAVFPAVDFRRAAWSGDTLVLEPDPAWAPDRNTTLRLGIGAKDRRGNALGRSFILRFTTKATPDSGRITGRAFAGREKTARSTLLVFAIPADTTAPWPEPVSLAEPDAEGRFVLDGVEPRGAWTLGALLDVDGDARPGGREEVWRTVDAGTFAPDSSVLAVPEFLVGSLDSTGRIRGDVKADSGRTAGVRAVATGDSATAVRTSVAKAGPFTLEVPTGKRYTVSAWLDLDGDGEVDADEPTVEPVADVRMDLASERTGLVFDLTGLAPPLATDSSASPPDTSGGGGPARADSTGMRGGGG